MKIESGFRICKKFVSMGCSTFFSLVIHLDFWRSSPPCTFMFFMSKHTKNTHAFYYRVLKGGGARGGGNWGTLRIPFGKIGEPYGR